MILKNKKYYFNIFLKKNILKNNCYYTLKYLLDEPSKNVLLKINPFLMPTSLVIES